MAAKPSLTQLRKALLAEVKTALLSEVTLDHIDELLPYPLYTVKEDRVVLANAIEVRVKRTGRIELRGLTSFGTKVLRQAGGIHNLDRLVTRYTDAVEQELLPRRSTHDDMLSCLERLCNAVAGADTGWLTACQAPDTALITLPDLLAGQDERLASLPARWHPAFHALTRYLAACASQPAPGETEIVSCRDCQAVMVWLKHHFQHYATARAGLKNINAVRINFTMELVRLLENDERRKALLRSFIWKKQVRGLRVDYCNRLFRLEPIVRQVKADCPRLLTPLISNVFGAYLVGVEARHDAHAGHLCNRISDKTALVSIKRWLDMNPRDVLPTWRAELIEKGLSPAGWRWLTKQSPADLNALFATDAPALHLVNLLAARQIKPKGRLREILGAARALIAWPHQQHPAYPALLEATARRCIEIPRARRNLPQPELAALNDKRSDLQNSIANILDWLNPQPLARHLHSDPATFARAGIALPATPDWYDAGARCVPPAKAGFDWFDRQQKAWHTRCEPLFDELRACNQAILATDEYAQAVREQRARTKWESAVVEYRDGEIDVVSLTNAQALADEGAAMRHCVGGYASDCVSGYSRIFSLRRNGKELATVELEATARGWVVAQAQGPCNSRVSTELRAVANRLADRYTAATQDPERIAA